MSTEQNQNESVNSGSVGLGAFLGDKITLCVTCNDEAKDAVNVCLMFANGRKGYWFAIPPVTKKDDPLAQRGYIGFKINNTGRSPSEKVDEILELMTPNANLPGTTPEA